MARLWATGHRLWAACGRLQAAVWAYVDRTRAVHRLWAAGGRIWGTVDRPSAAAGPLKRIAGLSTRQAISLLVRLQLSPLLSSSGTIMFPDVLMPVRCCIVNVRTEMLRAIPLPLPPIHLSYHAGLSDLLRFTEGGR